MQRYQSYTLQERHAHDNNSHCWNHRWYWPIPSWNGSDDNVWQKAAGNKLRGILKALTSKTWMGVLRSSVTAIIQSSAATTVMSVSFVNAGLMTLTQAIGVIMGANIGTTMTAQLIAFKLSDFALPARSGSYHLPVQQEKP